MKDSLALKTLLAFKTLLGAAIISACLASIAHAQTAYASGSQDWAGPYAGVHFGNTWADMKHDHTLGPSGTTDTLMGGGQIGYNWQRDQIVYGVEGDFSKLDAGSKSPSVAYDEDWGMTFRGRLGYAMGRFLPYGTVGLALTDTMLKIPGAGSNSNLQPGVAAGGGVDTMLTDRWVGRVEYLYTDVPEDSSTFGGTSVTGGSNNNTIRVGLNYKF